MADDIVQLAADGTGKKVDNSSLAVGANTVFRQRVVFSSDNNPSSFGTVFPAGFVRVSDEPTQIFYDPFDTLDATDRWIATSAGGGVGPAVAVGNLTIGTGTTINGYSHAVSKPSLEPTVPAWLGISSVIKLEYPIILNTYRFWGLGTAPGTPTAAAPLTDAIGFELATDGKLYAVVYASGVRTVIQDLSAATGNNKQPIDALSHHYIIYYRTDRIFLVY